LTISCNLVPADPILPAALGFSALAALRDALGPTPPATTSSPAAAPSPSSSGQQGLREAFAETGWVSLGRILDDAEVDRYVEAFDRSRREQAHWWQNNGIWQTQLAQPLLACTTFDGLLQHPRVVGALEELAGGEVVFQECTLRHMAPYDGTQIDGITSWEREGGPAGPGAGTDTPAEERGTATTGRRWHRDGGQTLAWHDHPLGVGYFQLFVYLTDVRHNTHSFAISPEPVGRPILDEDGGLDHAAQLAAGGVQEIGGVRGTAILFNIARLHTVCVRQTQAERKSVQAYVSAATD